MHTQQQVHRFHCTGESVQCIEFPVILVSGSMPTRLSFRFFSCHLRIECLFDLISFSHSFSDIFGYIAFLLLLRRKGSETKEYLSLSCSYCAYVDNALKDCFISQSHDMLIARLHCSIKCTVRSRSHIYRSKLKIDENDAERKTLK